MNPSRSRRAFIALGILIVVLAFPATVAAHAEFKSSTPAPNSTVVGAPDQLEVTFSEDVAAGSKFEVRDASGAVVATSGQPDGATLTADTSKLGPGAYEVQWTSIADDGHVERGSFSFTITAPTPSPTSSPSASAAPSLTPSPAATASPTATPPSDPAASSGNTLLPIVAGLVIVVALAAYLLRRRSAGRS
jgi:methionine-rich copper-binding protein CopC